MSAPPIRSLIIGSHGTYKQDPGKENCHSHYEENFYLKYFFKIQTNKATYAKVVQYPQNQAFIVEISVSGPKTHWKPMRCAEEEVPKRVDL